MIVMRDELERHAERLSEDEARQVWRSIRDRAFRLRRSWGTYWAVGGPVAVAAAALLIFVIGRGPDLPLAPTEVPEVVDLSAGVEPLGTAGEEVAAVGAVETRAAREKTEAPAPKGWGATGSRHPTVAN